MKILIAHMNKTFCVHIPLGLLCNRAGAALVAGGVRRMRRWLDVSTQTDEMCLITTDQAYALLKALKQGQQTLKQAGLPLADIEAGSGRVRMTL